MSHCLIGLGANLGNCRETLQRAVDLLAAKPQVRLLRVSQWHETRPVGGPANQPNYLNGAATVETSLDPRPLLAMLHDVENQLGRKRQERWAARSIDLDLLLHEDHVEQSDALTVPHPRMAWRRFVLEPAAEIAGPMVHPVIRWSVSRLLNHLNTTPRYVAVTGMDSLENARFARRVAETCSAELISDASRPNRARFHDEPSGRELFLALVNPALPITPRAAGDEPIQPRSDCIGAKLRLFNTSESINPSTRSGKQLPPRGPVTTFGFSCFYLKCLRRRMRLLAARDPRWSPPERYAISDFWFNESRVRAACRPLALDGNQLLCQWRRLEPRVVRPRLIVLVDAPAKKRLVDAPWRKALARQLRRVDTGPVLRIVDPCSPSGLDEVAAAIGAMG